MNPRDLNDPGLFMTWWVTHFCAAVFIFAVGISALLTAVVVDLSSFLRLDPTDFVLDVGHVRCSLELEQRRQKLMAELASLCLSGCFSKPLAVV
jgi:hypothetical protein